MNNLNKITCDTYPDWYEDQQKDEYLECLAIGRAHIGKNISTSDEYLIQLATKIAINHKYNKSANLTQEELNNIKQIHQENLNKIHITPPDGWYSTSSNPLNQPYVPEILPHNNVEPSTSNLIEDSTENV
jgi:hypothetical protein